MGKAKLNTILLPLTPDDVAMQPDESSAGYLGPEACAECHASYYESFVQTSHFKTSAEATPASVLGSFASDQNTLTTASPDLSFEMIEDERGLFQRMLFEGPDGTYGAEFPFDLVTGSGKIGQTYLHWQGNHLYQLHASYLTSTNRWMNSPGYVDGTADFARPVISHCLECHATYFQVAKETLNQYQKGNYVLGVTCEKCHGPGRAHVEYHQRHPESDEAHAIVNPANLPIERSREICQLCHGGPPDRMQQPPFSYRPGQPLSDYYTFSSEQVVGVHSNTQLPRLNRSKCYQASEMGCTDCHNPHQFERGDLRLFSERCLACHDAEACGKFPLLGSSIVENCIDCHMPRREMSDIVLQAGDQQHIPPMRDHYIRIWDDASRDYLKSLGLEP